MEGTVALPQRVTHVWAVDPPLRVHLQPLALVGLVGGDGVTAVLCEQGPSQLPPLGDFLLRKLVAAFGQHLRRLLLRLLAIGLGHALLHEPAPFLLNDGRVVANIRIDEPKVEVGVLVDEVEGPPRHLGAKLRLEPLVAAEALGCVLGRGSEEGEVGSAMGRIVPEPSHAAACRLGLQEVRPRRAVHRNCALPEALGASRWHRSAIWATEGSGGHSGREVIRRALVVVSQDIHDHLRGHGTLRRRHRARVRVHRAGQVALVRVELGTLGWAQEAKDAPHAASAVEGENVHETLGT
mmetsp:Transcript_5750/g.13984  ORF Transcript_5750/g.13984 Transcript_5750/m.13984 type:complete len:295 (-) Transcript_5750:973-1857(-)